jgi:hypothetical protein
MHRQHFSIHKMYCLLHSDFVIKQANYNHIIVDSLWLHNFFINLSDQADLITQKVDLVSYWSELPAALVGILIEGVAEPSIVIRSNILYIFYTVAI